MKELTHSELWINTKYFVDAFRCVCSLSYLQKHFSKIFQILANKSIYVLFCPL